jgi:hypothetical protein
MLFEGTFKGGFESSLCARISQPESPQPSQGYRAVCDETGLVNAACRDRVPVKFGYSREASSVRPKYFRVHTELGR